MMKRVLGIVLIVLGALSVLGASVNGTYAGFAYGIGISEIVVILFQILMLVCGIGLTFSKKKRS